MGFEQKTKQLENVSPLEKKKRERVKAFKELGDFAAGEVGNYIAGVHEVLDNDDEFIKKFGEQLKKKFARIRKLTEEAWELDRKERF